MVTFVSLFTGISIFILLYRRTRDYFNPVGVMVAVWSAVAALAGLKLSYLQTNFTGMMITIVVIYPIALAFGALLVLKRKSTYKQNNFQKIDFGSLFILLSRAIFIVCLICAFFEWKAQGFATFTTYNSLGDAKSIVVTIPVVHYGTVFLPFCALLSIYELIYRKNLKRKSILYNIIVILVVCVHSMFIIVSRGTLLIIAMGALYIFTRRYTIGLKQMIFLVLIILVGFVAFALKRMTSASLVFNNIPGHPYLSAIYCYTALNIENLNKLTQQGSNFYIFGRTFGGLWEILGLDGMFGLKETISTSFFNAVPLCYDFYDDLSIAGVIIYGTIFGAVLSWIYNKALTNKRYVLLYATLQKGIWVSFFGNYLTSSRILLFPYLIIAMLVYILKDRRRFVFGKR